MEHPVQARARVRDRFGAVLATSVSVLFVEAAIGAIALVVWGQTQESPRLAPNSLGTIFLILLAPVMAAVGAVVGTLLSVGVVMPLLTAAGWLGRGLSGREAWWWVPVVTATGAAPPVLTGTVLAGSGPLAGLGGWLMVTAVLVPPALVARRLLSADRRRLTGAAMFWRVVMYGTLAVIAACTLAVSALAAGIGYEPPRLSADRIAGTWSDGRGGTLRLTTDGAAAATRVNTFESDGSFEYVAHPCTGTGRWEYASGSGPWSQVVNVSIGACAMDAWEVFGTPEHPKLYVFIGDPDSVDLYILRRQHQDVSAPIDSAP
ncbi:hypothetical protein ACFYPA_33150 [Streptomyces sp. NPDC005775]|uniref:hypothetical protein n=1 Tax=unclassified Streptomyces TaxID=2593676 RepID=UPI0033E89E9F